MKKLAIYTTVLFAAVTMFGGMANADRHIPNQQHFAKAKNIIFFVGDGMGVSTVTASRIYSVGVDGELTMDQFPYTALLLMFCR